MDCPHSECQIPKLRAELSALRTCSKCAKTGRIVSHHEEMSGYRLSPGAAYCDCIYGQAARWKARVKALEAEADARAEVWGGLWWAMAERAEKAEVELQECRTLARAAWTEAEAIEAANNGAEALARKLLADDGRGTMSGVCGEAQAMVRGLRADLALCVAQWLGLKEELEKRAGAIREGL